jgi:hypothetical protein
MRLKIAAAVVMTALVGAAGATAQDEPQAISDATFGTLHVTTAVYVTAKAVELRGVWTDKSVKCSASRKLRIHAEVNYIPKSGKPKRFPRNGVFADANCAEGGPNVGYTITAKSLKLACPNGKWRPARYDFVVSATEPVRKLKSLADLSWFKRAC